MNGFGSILKYIELATSIGIAVSGVQAILHKPGPIQGVELLSVVQPALYAVQGINVKAKVPQELAAQICDSVAVTINTYYKKTSGNT